MTGMIPIHPGEILKEEILVSRKISQTKLAEDINVPVAKIRGICQAKRDIDADIALRLGVYFGTSFEFWLNLQQNYDLRILESDECLGSKILGKDATVLRENKIARVLKLDELTTNKLLHYHIESFALDSLISYVEKLNIPCQVKVIPEEPFITPRKTSNGRVRKHL
ncbi:20129_t:CDS:2 [Funneliformis geosporum]|nr:20129_t:CDS:2 [Funneliformis geosporum]